MLTPFHGSVGGRDLLNVHVCTFGLEAIEYLQPSRPIFFPNHHEREESTDKTNKQTNRIRSWAQTQRHSLFTCTQHE